MRRTLAALAGMVAVAGACSRSPTLTLATTTTVENSGLLATLLPEFERIGGIRVRAIVGGSGRALDILDRGDADVALTHDPEAEQRLFDKGSLALYRKVMFNDFVIAGPGNDPAGVRGSTTAVEAMRRIAGSDAAFASRADSSGTHSRELFLWQKAGGAPAGSRLIETGQGMASTLRIASERRAYVLTERSTFRQVQDTLQLQVLFEGDAVLVNTYAVMYTRGLAGTQLELARAFVSWLTEGPGRETIAQYLIKGQSAFTPWPAGARRDHPTDRPHAR